MGMCLLKHLENVNATLRTAHALNLHQFDITFVQKERLIMFCTVVVRLTLDLTHGSKLRKNLTNDCTRQNEMKFVVSRKHVIFDDTFVIRDSQTKINPFIVSTKFG